MAPRVKEVTIIRRFEGGLVEYQIGSRRFRGRFFLCPLCQVEAGEASFSQDRYGDWRCSECVREEAALAKAYWKAKTRETLSQIYAVNGEFHPDSQVRRINKVKAATPKWVDKAAIRAIYKEARLRTQEEGVIYHVDHIYPIVHHECCGLHVPWNLRVITAAENLEKRNGIPVFAGGVDGLPPIT
ncbi:MAG: hypothetical protein AB7R40_23505 [Nitrospiraceae bacterium]